MRGFTLVETLVSLAILMALLSVGIAPMMKYDSESRLIQEEAQELAMWFSVIMTTANREGGEIKIYFSQLPSGELEIRAVAAGENVASAKTVYRSLKAHIRNENASLSTVSYDGIWQTLTPALTLSVRSKTNRANKVLLTISAYGLVTVK